MQDRSWNRDEDYATLVKWWKQWEFGVVPKECLPPDGIIVEDNGTAIGAALSVSANLTEKRSTSPITDYYGKSYTQSEYLES